MFLWPQPNEEVHLNILADVCERFIFVHKDERVRRYLGRLTSWRAYSAALMIASACMTLASNDCVKSIVTIRSN